MELNLELEKILKLIRKNNQKKEVNDNILNEDEIDKIEKEKNKGDLEDQILSKDSKIYINLVVLKKFKIYKKDITKIKIKDNIQKFNIDFKNENFKLNLNNLLQNIHVKDLDLKIKLGVEDVMSNAILVGVISTYVSVLIRKYVKNIEELKYKIIPIYNEKNILKINVTGIIKLNFVKYISKEKSLMPNKALS